MRINKTDIDMYQELMLRNYLMLIDLWHDNDCRNINNFLYYENVIDGAAIDLVHDFENALTVWRKQE